MGVKKSWYLVCYDVSDPQRWAKVYKILKGVGEHLQLSVFRAHLSRIQLERLRFDFKKVMDEEDDLMIIQLCDSCAKRVIDTRNESIWKEESPAFQVF